VGGGSAVAPKRARRVVYTGAGPYDGDRGVLLVEGSYSNHALFLTGDEDLTGAGIAVTDGSATF
jgi:hypothetical protein